MRIAGGTAQAEPLWDRIAEGVRAAFQGGAPAAITAGFQRDTDQVQFFYQVLATEGVVEFAAYDVRRDQWLGPASRLTSSVAAAGAVEPIYSVASPLSGPLGPPSAITPSAIGTTQFTLTFALADTSADTFVYYKRSADTDWTETPLAPGVNTITVTGLVQSTPYDTKASAFKNGQESSFFVGPTVTTASPTCMAPSDFFATAYRPPRNATDPSGQLNWTVNEPLSQTVIQFKGPSDPGFYTISTTPVGAGSYVIDQVPASGTYQFQIYAIESGFNPSGIVGPVSVALAAYGGV